MTPRGRIRKRSLALRSSSRGREKGKESRPSVMQSTSERRMIETLQKLPGAYSTNSTCCSPTIPTSSPLVTSSAPHSSSPSIAHPSPGLDTSSTSLTVTYDYHQSPLPANFPLRSIAELSSVLPSDGPSRKDMCWWKMQWHQYPSPPSCPSRKKLRLAATSVPPSPGGYQHLLVLASQLQESLNHAPPPAPPDPLPSPHLHPLSPPSACPTQPPFQYALESRRNLALNEQPKDSEGVIPFNTDSAVKDLIGLPTGTGDTVSQHQSVNPNPVLDLASSHDDETFWSQAADAVSDEVWECQARGGEGTDVSSGRWRRYPEETRYNCGKGCSEGSCRDEGANSGGNNRGKTVSATWSCGGGSGSAGASAGGGCAGGESCEVGGGCGGGGSCASYDSDAADAFIDQLLSEGVISSPHTTHHTFTTHHLMNS